MKYLVTKCIILSIILWGNESSVYGVEWIIRLWCKFIRTITRIEQSSKADVSLLPRFLTGPCSLLQAVALLTEVRNNVISTQYWFVVSLAKRANCNCMFFLYWQFSQLQYKFLKQRAVTEINCKSLNLHYITLLYVTKIIVILRLFFF